MNKNLFISVIIPAFNAVSTIEKCLESIFTQTYNNFEIILINDGSYDDTLKIALGYAEFDARLKVYDQENFGVSKTRNRGLKLAKGDFFCYVDADDTVGNMYLENLVNGIKNDKGKIGLIIQQLKFINFEGKLINENNSTFIDSIVQKENFSDLFEFYDIVKYGFNCGKLFNLELVIKNNIRYNEKINISEDLIFMLQYLYYSDYVHFVEGAEYNYKIASYTLKNVKFASFLSESILLKEYLDILEKIKIKFAISENSLKKAKDNSGDIFMRLLYSMYRLNNKLPEKKIRIESIKNAVKEYNLCLKEHFNPVGIKEKVSKFLLINNLFTFFDKYRLYIRSTQMDRLNKN